MSVFGRFPRVGRVFWYYVSFSTLFLLAIRGGIPVLGPVVGEPGSVRSLGGGVDVSVGSGRVMFSGSVGTNGHVCCLSMGGGHGSRVFLTVARDGGIVVNRNSSSRMDFRGRGVFLCGRSFSGFVAKLARTVRCVGSRRKRVIGRRRLARRMRPASRVGVSVSFRWRFL